MNPRSHSHSKNSPSPTSKPATQNDLKEFREEFRETIAEILITVGQSFDRVDTELSSIKKTISNLPTKNDLTNFATKDDLSNFATKDDLSNFATKDDLSNFATKDDLSNFATKNDLTNFATKDDLEELNAKITNLPTKDDFYTYMDQIMGEYKSFNQESTLISGRVSDHEDRIISLEKKVAFS